MKNLFCAVAFLALSGAAWGDDGFSLRAGVNYSTGKYGNAVSTDILYVPVTAQYESGDLTLKLTVPYISITGPGGVIMGFGRIGAPTGTATTGTSRFGRPSTTGTTGTATATNSGLGDVIASAGYTVYSTDRLSLDAVGKIKFGTADPNKGLGTGQNDYSGQLDGYYTLVKNTTLLFTGGYKIMGAPPGVPTNNVPYGMLGLDLKTSEMFNVGAMYDVVKSVSPGIPDQRDLTLYAIKKMSPTTKLQLSVLKGFSTSSPDYGAGLMFIGYF